MVKSILLLFACLIFSTQAAAQEKVDIETWAKASAANLMRTKALVVETLTKSRYPKFQRLVKNDFFDMLGLEQSSVANSEMFFLVNELKPTSTLDAAKILNVDYAFESNAEGTKITHVASAKSITLPLVKSEKEYFTYLRRFFGFDGYVVDAKDDLLLVKYAGKSQEIGVQAIVLDSEEPFITTNAQVSGAFLVEMIEKSGDYGIFRVVIGDRNRKTPTYAKIQFSVR
jgi:hypothetical protein